MKKKEVYGVDMSKKITPIMVRDAIIRCFVKAHKNVLEEMKECLKNPSKEEFEEIKKLDVKFLVQKMFSDTGGDFEKPTKESLMKVVDKLEEYALNFRNPRVITRHKNEILQLIEKL